MKLAIINQTASTGGFRVLERLILALCKFKGIEITLFLDKNLTSHDLLKTIELNTKVKTENVFMELPKYVKKNKFKNTMFNNLYNLFFRIFFKITRKRRFKKLLMRKISKRLNNNFDCVLFFWPFFFYCPDKIKIPIFYIVQDLTFIYHFGFYMNSFMDIFCKLLTFVDKPNSIAIIPSNYGKKVFDDFFPNKKSEVIHWSCFSDEIKISKEKQEKILDSFGLLNKKYILYPTNLCIHKNVSAFYAVASKLIENGHSDIKFILTGLGTEEVCGKLEDGHVVPYELICKKQTWDIKGFGMVSDDEINTLIKNATIVVTTSLAEGGCGPCSDAWVQGTPTVISSIDVLVEYAKKFGVKTEIGDPRNLDQYVSCVEKILSNYDKYKKIAEENAKKVKDYNWNDVAKQYLKVFEENKK